jgi:hypothetical protein
LSVLHSWHLAKYNYYGLMKMPLPITQGSSYNPSRLYNPASFEPRTAFSSSTMRFSVFALVSAASATAINLAERGLSGQYPYIQVLPVPGINTTSDEIDNLASIYSGGAKDLYAQAYSISKWQSNYDLGLHL